MTYEGLRASLISPLLASDSSSPVQQGVTGVVKQAYLEQCNSVPG
jgi:hypothetical protein